MTCNTFYYQNPYLNFSNPYAPSRRPLPRPPAGPHYTASRRPLPRPPAGPPPLSMSAVYEKQLGEGLNVSEHTIDIVKQLMPKILQREQDDQIVWCTTTQNYVFSLKATPRLIFKIASNLQGNPPGANNEFTKEQFDNMVVAKKACMDQALHLLELPKAKKFQVDGTLVIAQERVEIPLKKRQFYQHRGLERALGHLTTLIAKTGLSPELKKIPGKRVPGRNSLRRDNCITLWNLGKREGAHIGILKLIECLPLQRQIDVVFKKATQERIVSTNPTLKEARDTRVRGLQNELQREEERQLHLFHKQNGIIDNERKPLEIKDWEQLGLPLSETSLITEPIKRDFTQKNVQPIPIVINTLKSITLQEMVEKVILVINKAIEGSPDNLPLKFKRQVQILFPPKNLSLGSEDKQKKWIIMIVHALVRTKYIFTAQQGVNGFTVQA